MEACIETFHVVTEDGQLIESFSGVSGARRFPFPYNCAVGKAFECAAERNEPVFITDKNERRLAIVTENTHTPL